MYTAVVIGATGAGNYGHDLDLAWQFIPAVEVVAVTDVDEELARAKADQLGARQAFGDFREMLHRVQADFVTVCLRRPHERSEMMLAAIEAGAKGIYCEKPFVRTPAEADAVVAAAERGGTKIQVAHNWRVDPKVRRMLEMVRAGDIGRLVAMHATGKNDSRRGGAEDLAVLGVHQLDLLRQFAGDPRQLSANVMQAGRPVGIQDAREGNENLGLMAGDQIFATLLFDHGVTGTFSSVRTGRGMHRQMGIELVGTAGLLSLRGGPTTGQPLLINRRPELDPGVESNWETVPVPPLDAEALGDTEGKADVRQLLHTTMTRDLVRAVEQNRRPICDAIDGRWTVEMVLAVHEAGLTQQTVRFPLQVRENPYAARRQMALADV
ncbi:MAG: Gfo/Idh/MocA family oxidoreductase [Chloroflexota bacterium]|nr:Gfo/Idh/MocA family oxidoreductase [Chloroflexota bacterium]MDE2918418.1 Gfo/Idh/MocA family oxidoreductase [Chloroflexota bacterium]